MCKRSVNALCLYNPALASCTCCCDTKRDLVCACYGQPAETLQGSDGQGHSMAVTDPMPWQLCWLITRLRLAGIEGGIPGLQQAVSTCTRLRLGVPLSRRVELAVHLLDVLLIAQQRGVDDLQRKHAADLTDVEGGDATTDPPRIIDAMHWELFACNDSRLRAAMHHFPIMQYAPFPRVRQDRG